MNSLLIEMLASRANNGSNPVLADMLARMRDAPESTRNPVSADWIAQASHGNPMLSIVAKHLAESQKNRASAQRVIEVEPEEVHESDPMAGLETPVEATSGEAIAELREQVENMFAELKALRDRNDVLAAALGACCLCWGEDAHCRICRGRGSPGFSVPDETFFAEFVLPAIHTLRAQKAKGKPSAPKFQAQTTK